VRPEETIGALSPEKVAQGGQARLDVDHLFAYVSSADWTHFAIILVGMVLLDTPRRRHSANRGWAIAALLLWVVAAALAVIYLWGIHDRVSAGTSTTSAAAARTSVEPSTWAALFAVGSSATIPEVPTTTTTEPPPTTTTTEAPTTTTTTLPPALTVAAGGDVLGDRGVGVFMDKSGGEPVFAQVKPLLDSAQLAFINLEGPISEKGTRASWKEYTFRARPALLDGLLSGGVDIVSLANNHSMDYGASALLDTIARLDEAGIYHAGAGADAAAASAPTLIKTAAGTVAVVAITDIIPGGFAAGPDNAGVNVTTPDRKKLLATVAAADKKADFVIVSLHWGIEYKPHAGQEQRKLAHQLVDAGADLILGHHPHVIQGLELYRNRLIAYSFGDFVWDHYSRETGETFVLQVAIQPEGPPSFEVVPVYLDQSTGVPAPVTGDEAAAILGRLAGLSADLGLELTISEDRASFTPQAAKVGPPLPATSPGPTDASAPGTTTSSTL
jgi:poly-gamma-glutamate capsule biosynthesis protein CapA/YwtB (metallophosphatase superfamily)